MTGPRVDSNGRTARDYESHDRVYAHHTFGFPQHPDDDTTWIADDGSTWRYTGGGVEGWWPISRGATVLAPRNGDPDPASRNPMCRCELIPTDDAVVAVAVEAVLATLMHARAPGWVAPSELMTLADELAPLAEAIVADYTLTRKDPTT